MEVLVKEHNLGTTNVRFSLKMSTQEVATLQDLHCYKHKYTNGLLINKVCNRDRKFKKFTYTLSVSTTLKLTTNKKV